MISGDVKLGKNVIIFHPELVNLYGCEIGDNCKIGTFVEIRKDVKIGRNCKIQAGAFIPEKVTIEDNVFIGPHVVFTNDKYPKAVDEEGNLLKPGGWVETPTLVKRGDRFNYIATQNSGIPGRFEYWNLIYSNPKTLVKLYSLGGQEWMY